MRHQLKATRGEAIEHIATAWSHIESGDRAKCLAELDKALAILRPAPAAAPPPAPVPDWSGAKPAKTGGQGTPVMWQGVEYPSTRDAARATLPRNVGLHAHETRIRRKLGLENGNTARRKAVESEDGWWESALDAAIAIGCSRALVGQCCLGMLKTAGGHRFRFSQHPTREEWEAARSNTVPQSAA